MRAYSLRVSCYEWKANRVSTNHSLLLRKQSFRPVNLINKGLKLRDPRSGYDATAPYYDKWGWQAFWRANEWPVIEKILGNELRPRTVLDLGVGTGFYLKLVGQLYPNSQLVGLDFSAKMLSIARSRLGEGAWLVCADARAIPFKPDAFDLVLMNRVSSHIEDLVLGTSEIARVMRPGGLLVVSDVSPEHDYSCTSLPTVHGKIGVETYKHSLEDWDQACRAACLQLENSFEINRDNASAPETYPSSNGEFGRKPVGFVRSIRKSADTTA